MRSFGEISATLWSCVEIVIVDTRDTETRRAFQTSPSLALSRKLNFSQIVQLDGA